MKNLHALLRGFSKPERYLLMQYLSVVPSNHLGKDNKLLRLASYLLSCEVPPTCEECTLGVYGRGKGGKKIFNLINRLRNKVLEFSISDQALDQSEYLEEQDLTTIRARKQIAQFQALYYAGKVNEAVTLLDETIDLALEYEFYSGLVECLKFKKWMVGFREGEKQFDAFAEKIAYYDKCNRIVNNAADTYYRVIMKNDFSSATNSKEKYRALVYGIARMKKDHAETKSAVVEYYLKLLEMDYYQEREEYLKARSTCLQLITIVRFNKSVFRKSRVASAYTNLSRCELYLGRYDSAIEYSREAQKIYASGSVNYMVAREQEFYALFFSGNTAQAHKMAQRLAAYDSVQLGDFRYDKYRFFLACTLFKEKKFHQSLKILESYQEIAKDKAGWEIAIRLLRIMCYVETGNLDGAILQIDAFRKHISKHSSKILLNNRYQVILRLLQMLEKEGFVIKTVNPRLLDYQALLRSKNTFYSWEMIGPELIPFHVWFESRITYRVKGRKASVAF